VNRVNGGSFRRRVGVTGEVLSFGITRAQCAEKTGHKTSKEHPTKGKPRNQKKEKKKKKKKRGGGGEELEKQQCWG